jgi:hypothetical protein
MQKGKEKGKDNERTKEENKGQPILTESKPSKPKS